MEPVLRTWHDSVSRYAYTNAHADFAVGWNILVLVILVTIFIAYGIYGIENMGTAIHNYWLIETVILVVAGIGQYYTNTAFPMCDDFLAVGCIAGAGWGSFVLRVRCACVFLGELIMIAHWMFPVR